MDIVQAHELALYSHAWKRWRQRTKPISAVVVHHSAIDSDAPTVKQVEAISRYHVESNQLDPGGGPTIAYHYVIGKRGLVCNPNDDSWHTWHAGNRNGHTLGVCLLGNYEDDYPPGEQVSMFLELFDVLKEKHGQDLKLERHHDSCPSLAFEAITGTPPDVRPQTMTEVVHELPSITELDRDFTHEQKQGMEHWLREAYGICQNFTPEQIEAIAAVRELCRMFGEGGIEAFIQREVVSGSRKNMVARYGTNWEGGK